MYLEFLHISFTTVPWFHGFLLTCFLRYNISLNIFGKLEKISHQIEIIEKKIKLGTRLPIKSFVKTEIELQQFLPREVRATILPMSTKQ